MSSGCMASSSWNYLILWKINPQPYISSSIVYTKIYYDGIVNGWWYCVVYNCFYLPVWHWNFALAAYACWFTLAYKQNLDLFGSRLKMNFASALHKHNDNHNWQFLHFVLVFTFLNSKYSFKIFFAKLDSSENLQNLTSVFLAFQKWIRGFIITIIYFVFLLCLD